MLFNNTTDIKNFLPVNVSLEFVTIKPFIELVERNYLSKLLGDALYQEVCDIDQRSTLNQKELLLLCKTAVIYLALWKWSLSGSVSISDLGITRTESDKQKSAFKYQEAGFRESMKQEGHNALDNVLYFLELHINYFNSFKSSGTYTILTSHFINYTVQFDSFFPIGKSRLVFIRLMRYIILVEDFEIKPEIGVETFNSMIKIIAGDSGSGDGADLKILVAITYLQRAIANLAIAKACQELNINITDKGLFFEAQEGNSSTFDQQYQASQEQISNLSTNADLTGRKYLQLAIDHMKANITMFPDYAASSAYSDASGSAGMNFNNTDKKIIRT